MTLPVVPWQPLAVITALGLLILLSRQVNAIPRIPLGLFICYFTLVFFERLLKGYGLTGEWLNYFQIWSWIFLSWGVARVLFWLIMGLLGRFKQADEVPPKITHDFLLFITFVILFLLILRMKSDINLASLLTTSAVITVVIGLAVQATLNNFFSGLIIQAERPFSIGDWLEFEGKEGRVVGISWKSTQLLTRDQVLVYIPNSTLASGTFTNFSQPSKKKIARIYIGLEYGVPYNKVKDVILQVVRQHPRILKRPRPTVRLIEYGDFSINYEIRICHTSYAYEPQLKADVYQQLWYALRRNGIRIPFPIRDVYHGHVERRHQEKKNRSIQSETKAMMARVPILAPLSEGELDALSKNVAVRLYGQGELIVQENEDGDSMYIIRSGACEAIAVGENGRKQVLSTLMPGDFFGEISLLTGEKRSATIKAVEDTSLIVIHKDGFSKIMSANPVISEEIARVVLERQKKPDNGSIGLEGMNGHSRKLIHTIKTFFGI